MSKQRLFLKESKLMVLLKGFYTKIYINQNKDRIFSLNEINNIHILNRKHGSFNIDTDHEFKFILKPKIDSGNKIVIPKNTYYMLRKDIRPIWNFEFVYYYIDHVIRNNIRKLLT
jgi:hypothetical protein